MSCPYKEEEQRTGILPKAKLSLKSAAGPGPGPVDINGGDEFARFENIEPFSVPFVLYFLCAYYRGCVVRSLWFVIRSENTRLRFLRTFSA